MGCGCCNNKDCIVNKNKKKAHEHDHAHEHHAHDHHHEHGYGHEHGHDHGAECFDHDFSCNCGCGHDHMYSSLDDKGMRKKLIRIIIAVVLFVIVFVIDKIVVLASINPGEANWVLPFVCYFIVYLILGKDILKAAVSGIKNGEFLDENFLMSIASLGAFALGIYKGCIGEEPDGFEEGCAVVIFYTVGEWFQSRALMRSRKSINELADMTQEITQVFAGSSVRGMNKPLPESEAEIRELVESAPQKKAHAETFIARFAKIYTPIVVGLALAVAILPPIFGLICNWGTEVDVSFTTWIYRALSFLVVSCPCALVISIPLSFFMGIGTAGRYHILIKGSNCLEMIAKANIFVADTDGTLAIGKKVKPEAKDVVSKIRRMGDRVMILSGDQKQAVRNVADELKIDQFSYELDSKEKIERFEEIMKAKTPKDTVVYMGDGVHDAELMIRADVGVSMGTIGADTAEETENLVLMKDNIYGIPLIKALANRTMSIVRQNIIFTIGIKVLVLILSAFGITNMWFAVFADVGVALLAVLNALRVGAVRYKENEINE